MDPLLVIFVLAIGVTLGFTLRGWSEEAERKVDKSHQWD